MKVEITAEVKAPLSVVWAKWTEEDHIKHWNFASDEWHCPKSENDLRVGGKFKNRMEAKDGSFGFEFEGEYTVVDDHQRISYQLGDGREVDIFFSSEDSDHVIVREVFDPETENPIEMQQQGWQSILNNFKRYVERT